GPCRRLPVLRWEVPSCPASPEDRRSSWLGRRLTPPVTYNPRWAIRGHAIEQPVSLCSRCRTVPRLQTLRSGCRGLGARRTVRGLLGTIAARRGAFALRVSGRGLLVGLAAVIGLIETASFKHDRRPGAEQPTELRLSAFGAFLLLRLADVLKHAERVSAGITLVIVPPHQGLLSGSSRSLVVVYPRGVGGRELDSGVAGPVETTTRVGRITRSWSW